MTNSVAEALIEAARKHNNGNYTKLVGIHGKKHREVIEEPFYILPSHVPVWITSADTLKKVQLQTLIMYAIDSLYKQGIKEVTSHSITSYLRLMVKREVFDAKWEITSVSPGLNDLARKKGLLTVTRTAYYKASDGARHCRMNVYATRAFEDAFRAVSSLFGALPAARAETQKTQEQQPLRLDAKEDREQVRPKNQGRAASKASKTPPRSVLIGDQLRGVRAEVGVVMDFANEGMEILNDCMKQFPDLKPDELERVLRGLADALMSIQDESGNTQLNLARTQRLVEEMQNETE